MKRSHLSLAMIAASLFATAMLVTACGSSSESHNRLVPPEQQASDLKRALDAGIISQDEYEEEMEKLRDGD
jgi:ABC-type phosphate/phosphonate transport system substrate-binding protein